ncbi:MAG: helix-turn-helix domain-containing protein, partial [Acidobacteriota bacterium]
SSTPLRVNIRVIAASNQDIEVAVRDKRFRSDLLYRLRVITLPVPPLRERCEDIPLLVEYFIKQHTPSGRTRPSISKAALDLLQHYQWPGNVRELENVIERAVVLNSSTVITPEDLPQELHRNVIAELPAGIPISSDEEVMLSLAEVQQRHIRRVLDAMDGNKSRAARVLGIDRKTLERMLKRQGGNS